MLVKTSLSPGDGLIETNLKIDVSAFFALLEYEFNERIN